MNKERKTVNMRMSKQEIFEQGLHMFKVSKKLYQEVQKLTLVNASLINSMKYILENVDGFNAEYEENDEVSSEVKKNLKKQQGVEVQ